MQRRQMEKAPEKSADHDNCTVMEAAAREKKWAARKMVSEAGVDNTQAIESPIDQMDDESAFYDWTPEEKILSAKPALTSTAKH